MADSIKRANAHNTHALLTHINTLSKKAKKQLFDLLPLLISEKAGKDRKTLLVLTENNQQRYTGLSLDIATTIYLSLLERATNDVKHGIRINIEFYAINRHDVKQDLGGVQS